MEKPHKLTTGQYVGLVRDIDSRMAQMSPLFDKYQQLDKSELVNSIANKAPRSHKAMLISQGFNPETRYLETFVEHWERAENTQSHQKAVCGIGSRSQFKDGIYATPVWQKPTTGLIRTSGFAL